MKKYKLTNETMQWQGRTLHRIQALRNFGNVVAGELGGWVESENNLDHDGECWVYDEGKVCDNSTVSGNGKVRDNGSVFEYGEVYDNGEVSDYGEIYGNGEVYDNGTVAGYGQVSDNGFVCDNGKVRDNGEVRDNGCVAGNGEVSDNGSVSGYGQVCANAVVTKPAHYLRTDGYDVTVTDNHIRVGYQQHTKEEWERFTTEQAEAMESEVGALCDIYRVFILKLADA